MSAFVCQNNRNVRLTREVRGIILRKPVALDKSTQASTIVSLSDSVMYAIASESDFVMSSLDVEILLISKGSEFRFDIWYK